MQTKQKYDGQDLKNFETALQNIAAQYPLRHVGNYQDYALEEEFLALDTECKLVCSMYKLNDFRASSYAYVFTVKKCEEIIDYCYRNMQLNPDVLTWSNQTSDLTKVRQPDGSAKTYPKLGYVFDYLRRQQMAIAARYFIEYNIQYLELDKPKKSYPSRRRLLEGAIWWFNQGILGKFGLKMPFTKNRKYDMKPQIILFSTPPSSGKTFLINTTNEMFSELGMIINESGGFLRIGNQEDNILEISNQTRNLIRNPAILDIYPENSNFFVGGKYKPFAKDSAEEWSLCGTRYTPNLSIFKTRDATINSVRCDVVSVDDPSRGQQENTNINIHNHIISLFYGDISDRFESQDDKLIFLTGTMFAPFDVFSVVAQDALKGAVKDERFRGTYINKEKRIVLIINDIEDTYGKSAYPEFMSNWELQQKRATMDTYAYSCIWRQKPIPAEGLIFDYSKLRTYTTLPEDELEQYAFAYIDPTRRSAKDFFSMPICRRNKIDGSYYMVDCIYEQKSSIDELDNVISKILQNKIIKIIIEENADSSLAQLIKDRLVSQGVKWCEVVSIYNTVNKAMRIAAMEGTVKGNIVFPAHELFPVRHPLSMFTRDFTQYSAVGSSIVVKHDDAPDSICGFAQHLIINANIDNIIKTSNRSIF